MEGLLQEAIDLGKNITVKLNPILDKVAVWISGKIDIPSENIHMFLVLGGSLYLGYIINGKEIGIKALIYGGLIFWGLRWLGL